MQQLSNLCLVCFGLIVMKTAAADVQSLQTIHDAAREFMRAHTATVYAQEAEIKPGRLDSRLRLHQCAVPLEVFLPEGSRDLGRLTVGVRCTDSKPWSLHVPMTVTIYKDVVVTAKPLERGAILMDTDFKRVSYDVSKLPNGYIEDETKGVGMELKRRVSAGAPLTTSMMKKPRIIKRGQQVAIIANAGNMEVRMTGKALAHGAVGDRIRVLNTGSNKKIEGTVTASGDIRVDI